MDAVSSTGTSAATTTTTPSITSPTSSTSTSKTTSLDISTSDGFEGFLKSMLLAEQGNNISEEELFAGVAKRLVSDTKGADAATKFQQYLDEGVKSTKQSDGFVPWEQVTDSALKKMVSNGDLSASEGDTLYSQAFAASQLDQNTGALYDNRGSTQAVADTSIAIKGSLAKLAAYKDGSATAPTLSLAASEDTTTAPNGLVGSVSSTAASAGGAVNGETLVVPTEPAPTVSQTINPQLNSKGWDGGFLFKPAGQNSNKLVVLAPKNIYNSVASVTLKDSSGATIEKGQLMKGSDGTGLKYNFSKPGGSYPKNLQVQMTFNNGTTYTYNIPDPSKRYSQAL